MTTIEGRTVAVAADGGLAHRARRFAVALTGVFAATVAIAAFAAPASAGVTRVDTPLEACIKRRMADGEAKATATAACLREQSAPASTTRPDSGDEPVQDSGGAAAVGNDGTSTGLLLAVGAAGAVLGAGLTILLRKRGVAGAPVAGAVAHPGAPGAVPGYATSPAPTAPPPMFSAPGASAPADRSPGLVTSLVDLSDRVPSVALRAEILAALARAGVQAIEPAQGDVFDVNRMRGVGSTPAPDPSWVGRVAATERAGFQDGPSTVRPPEVVVYTAGG